MLLQHNPNEKLEPRKSSFSPLFVGEASSTTYMWKQWVNVILFQSPLRWENSRQSSVVSCQSPSPEPLTPSPCRSRPLFIGESSSTADDRSRGRGAAVSVPSSSGKALQPLNSTPVFSAIQATTATNSRRPQIGKKPRSVCEIRGDWLKVMVPRMKFPPPKDKLQKHSYVTVLVLSNTITPRHPPAQHGQACEKSRSFLCCLIHLNFGGWTTRTVPA
jgi:hypothetical protein